MPFHPLIFPAMLSVACAYAAIRGGPPERVAAAAQATATASMWICARLAAQGLMPDSGIELGVTLTDLAWFVTIVGLALVSTRFWPMLMAGMIGCALSGHIARLFVPDILPTAYYAMDAFWGYWAVLLLMIATLRHRARFNRYGTDHCWVAQLPQPEEEGRSVGVPPFPHCESDSPVRLKSGPNVPVPVRQGQEEAPVD